MPRIKQQPAAPCVVLMAEDEPIIRMLGIDVLTEAGFTVLEAAHAGEALAFLEARAGSIHVLFTDIHMPGGLDGLELAHHASVHWPWVGILVASGGSLHKPLKLPARSRFVAKPYELHHVVDHVRDLATAC